MQAYRNIPVFAEYNEVRANRVDARIVDHRAKTGTTLEMSYPWIQNREEKDEEKVLKYEPLCWTLKQQFKGYKITRYNIIMDVLGGWSSSMEVSLSQLLGNKCKEVLRANPCKNRPKSPIRGKAQKIKIALLLQTGTL